MKIKALLSLISVWTFVASSSISAQVVNLSTAEGDFMVATATEWTVPTNVNSIEVTVVGAGGGNGEMFELPPLMTLLGGKGASITATLSVVPGDVLLFVVGERGGDTDGNDAGSGGGGASGIFDISNNTFTPLIISGGGGGVSNVTFETQTAGDASLINTAPAGLPAGEPGGFGGQGGAGGGAGSLGLGTNGIGIGGFATFGANSGGKGGDGIGAGGGGGLDAGGGGGATGGAQSFGGVSGSQGGSSYLSSESLGSTIPNAAVTNMENGSISISYRLPAPAPVMPIKTIIGFILLIGIVSTGIIFRINS